MIDNLNLSLILTVALLTFISPGPATLSIAGTSMALGRKHGLTLAAGVITGSLFWSISAALGLGAVLQANEWVFHVIRYGGAAYLLYLAYKSARSALLPGDIKTRVVSATTPLRAYTKGLIVNVTNPESVLFYGSLYAIGMPKNPSDPQIAIAIGALGILVIFLYVGFALIFSNSFITRGYLKLYRWLEGFFALAFTAASIEVLLAKIQ
ncbi:MAG: LysE family translocator [Sneathiella sp.]|uniref:LysE family translocator n=1 Tax=Sneathiella sp. TaxID=1964365 RepID=UPI0030016340